MNDKDLNELNQQATRCRQESIGSVISLEGIGEEVAPFSSTSVMSLSAVVEFCGFKNKTIYILGDTEIPAEMSAAAEKYGVTISHTPENSKRHKRILAQVSKDARAESGAFAEDGYGGIGRSHLRTYGEW
jgi:hypothetical protein